MSISSTRIDFSFVQTWNVITKWVYMGIDVRRMGRRKVWRRLRNNTWESTSREALLNWVSGFWPPATSLWVPLQQRKQHQKGRTRPEDTIWKCNFSCHHILFTLHKIMCEEYFSRCNFFSSKYNDCSISQNISDEIQASHATSLPVNCCRTSAKTITKFVKLTELP